MNNNLKDLGQHYLMVKLLKEFKEKGVTLPSSWFNDEYVKKIIEYLLLHDGFCKSHTDIANSYNDKNTKRFQLGLEICIREKAVKRVKEGYELIQNDTERQLIQSQPVKEFISKYGKTIRRGKIPIHEDKMLFGKVLNQKINGVKVGGIFNKEYKRAMKKAKDEEKKVNGFKTEVKMYKNFKKIKHQ